MKSKRDVLHWLGQINHDEMQMKKMRGEVISDMTNLVKTLQELRQVIHDSPDYYALKVLLIEWKSVIVEINNKWRLPHFEKTIEAAGNLHILINQIEQTSPKDLDRMFGGLDAYKINLGTQIGHLINAINEEHNLV
jgi:hypothetical protein